MWLINITKEEKEDKYVLHMRRGKICALCAINEGHDAGTSDIHPIAYSHSLLLKKNKKNPTGNTPDSKAEALLKAGGYKIHH